MLQSESSKNVTSGGGGGHNNSANIIHSNDEVGKSIIMIKFNGTNYPVWSKIGKVVFRTEKKLKFFIKRSHARN